MSSTSSPAVRGAAPCEDSESALSRILAKLSHLDLSGQVLDKEAAKDAHGGYCDVFIGRLPVECLPNRRVTRSTAGRMVKVKVAIKHIRVRLDKEVQVAKALAREMAIWSTLNHRNILPFLGYMLEKTYPSLISPWMEHGTIRNFLGAQPEFDIVFLAHGIAKGLKYMHDRNFIHSDLKSDNILIGDDLRPLICDFGISRMLDSSESNFISTTHDGQIKGSARWMAMELYKATGEMEPRHTKATDVWAFGMTLYEMLAKKLPYAHLKKEVQVVLAVMDGDLPALPRFSDTGTHLSPLSYEMVCEVCRGCWARSPEKRLTMKRVLRMISSQRSLDNSATLKLKSRNHAKTSAIVPSMHPLSVHPPKNWIPQQNKESGISLAPHVGQIPRQHDGITWPSSMIYSHPGGTDPRLIFLPGDPAWRSNPKAVANVPSGGARSVQSSIGSFGSPFSGSLFSATSTLASVPSTLGKRNRSDSHPSEDVAECSGRVKAEDRADSRGAAMSRSGGHEPDTFASSRASAAREGKTSNVLRSSNNTSIPLGVGWFP